MIRVHKPDGAPRILRDRGVTLTAELCRQADAGERPTFDRSCRDVYGHGEVKLALRAAQHDKCCFCESKLGHAQFGDVEHFRPKAEARQSPDVSVAMGYYWLVYVWDNLYLSCEICNRRHKRGLFPLLNPDHRVASHHRAMDLDQEQPVFVDPGKEDPILFIEFRREYAAPVKGSIRGAETIKALQLNRLELQERRRDRYKMLVICVTALASAIRRGLRPNERNDVLFTLHFVIAAAADGGEYSSMTRAFLRAVAPWRHDWAPPAASLLAALEADAAAGHALRIPEL